MRKPAFTIIATAFAFAGLSAPALARSEIRLHSDNKQLVMIPFETASWDVPLASRGFGREGAGVDASNLQISEIIRKRRIYGFTLIFDPDLKDALALCRDKDGIGPATLVGRAGQLELVDGKVSRCNTTGRYIVVTLTGQLQHAATGRVTRLVP